MIVDRASRPRQQIGLVLVLFRLRVIDLEEAETLGITAMPSALTFTPWERESDVMNRQVAKHLGKQTYD